MRIVEIRQALQDLIIRLQDAEKGYNEIQKSISNPILKKWMNKYAEERHSFHKDLEIESSRIGGDPDVKTSLLGDLHRMFIDVKINNSEDSIVTIVDEIERGSNILIADYEKVIDNIEMPMNLRKLLEAQKWKIQQERKSLVELREHFMSPYETQPV
jgi:uncharacterized protein (TIGR02284 family)